MTTAGREGLLTAAHALLHFIRFDEPFGDGVVESMACGTPVIAAPRGSMPESVSDGRMGFLVTNVDQERRAVEHAGALDRHIIRTATVQRFGRTRMVERYVDVYRGVMAAGSRRRRACGDRAD